MITSVRLQNFKSFGALQTAPLEAITVLVGANSSGKSNFLSFVKVIQRATQLDGDSPDIELFHRPPSGEGKLLIQWQATLDGNGASESSPRGEYQLAASRGDGIAVDESISIDGVEVYRNYGDTQRLDGVTISKGPYGRSTKLGGPLLPMRTRTKSSSQIDALMHPVLDARVTHLSVEALRASAGMANELGSDGANLASQVAQWRMECPDKMDEFDAIIRRCLPEPGARPGSCDPRAPLGSMDGV